MASISSTHFSNISLPSSRDGSSSPFLDDDVSPYSPPIAIGHLSSLKTNLIGKVVKATLTEVIISVTMVAVTCLFLATPGGAVAFVAITVSVLAFNLIIRMAASYVKYQIESLKHASSPSAISQRHFYEQIATGLSFVCPATFGILYNSTLSTLIHEAGHVAAANLVYHNPVTKLEITGLGSGVTWTSATHLSDLGAKIGSKNASLVLSAGGSLLVAFNSFALITAAFCLKDKNPQLSKYFVAMAIMDTLTNMIYALSALTPPLTAGHDFGALALGGIHPLLSCAVALLAPLVFTGLLYLLEYLYHLVADYLASGPVTVQDDQVDGFSTNV